MKKEALQIITKLQNEGYQAVYAGGYVRDMIMGNKSNDIDIATDALPDEVESLFDKTIAVGKAFGVIVVVINNIEFEIATFRNDGDYIDGRRPEEVEFSSMEEDAKRRDLTINSLFYDPIEDKIYDFVGGQEDIKNKTIRLIGTPNNRIEEDHLRMMRVGRFAIRFNFNIEGNTFLAVRKNSHKLSDISNERVSDEFMKMLRLHEPDKMFDFLFVTELIKYISPEIEKLYGCEQPEEFHPEGDCAKHTILALENLPKDASNELLMATLLHDIGKPNCFKVEERIRFDGHDKEGVEVAETILKRMKFSNTFIERVCELIGNHMKWMCVQKMKKSKLKRFMRLPFFEEHKLLHKADCISSYGKLDNLEFIEQKEEEFDLESEVDDALRPEAFVNGHDLITLGFSPSPLFKEILTKIEDEQLEGTITNREKAIEFIKKNYLERIEK